MELKIITEILESTGIIDWRNHLMDFSKIDFIMNSFYSILTNPNNLDLLYNAISELPREKMPILLSELMWWGGSSASAKPGSPKQFEELVSDLGPEEFDIMPEEHIESYGKNTLQYFLIATSKMHINNRNISGAIDCEEKLIELLGGFEQNPEIKCQTAYAYGHLAKLHDKNGDLEKETLCIYREVALFSKVLEEMNDDDYAEKARISYDSAQALMALSERLPKDSRKNKYPRNKKYSSKTKCYFQALKRLNAADDYQNMVDASSPDSHMMSNILRKKIKCYGELSKISEDKGKLREQRRYCEKITTSYDKLTKHVSFDGSNTDDSTVIKIYEEACLILDKFQRYWNNGAQNPGYL